MPNPRPLTYTEAAIVCLTPLQREQLRRYARRHETAISIVLREAALEEIGREDLSLADETAFTIGRQLGSPGRSRAKRGHSTRSYVNLTGAQKQALSEAAEERGVSLSGLLRDAGLRAARVRKAPRKKAGRTPGSRNAGATD